ncbi:alpha/beta fold hydrolase [Brevundimonas sp. FT23028]|uniref:alpha/beta fold hydrolase n=1 Tax=Brevundimonas sp. FT23028 TaxID=3393748 RepID=UPI003B58797D
MATSPSAPSPGLSVNLLGRLEVRSRDRAQPLPLPASRKTRALLGYLLLTGSPQRRDRLCELFWDIPDDPRGALRWSLTKLRPLLNRDGAERLTADRERVEVLTPDIDVDLHRVRACADDAAAPADALAEAWRSATGVLLEDSDLPNQGAFTLWLEAERDSIRQARATLARRLAFVPEVPAEEQLVWAGRWLEDAPFDPEAARAVVRLTRRIRGGVEAGRRADDLDAAFRDAGLPAPDWTTTNDAPPPLSTPAPPPRPRQTVRFVRARDGVNLAWASVGAEDAPPLVKAANWLTHLELDWEAPIWSPLYRELAMSHRLVRYDGRGCGLSDWEVPEITFETFVSDLETAVDAAGLDRFPLLGISQGASVSIEYAVRHPERVSHLILFGGYPAGWRHLATPAEVREREAVMVLTEAGWGRADPAYRRLFSGTFMPDATPDELDWFDEFQRRTTSARNAVRFLEAFSTLDVRHRLDQVKAPTLVIHSRGDRRIPLSTGRDLATSIPSAEFIGLDSNNHLLIGREPAATAFISAVRRFIADH